jgi:hypothetical protein
MAESGAPRRLVGGAGGAWLVDDVDRRVLLVFESASGERVFSATITPEVAVEVAQALVAHARAAGFDNVITFTLGGPRHGRRFAR